MTKSVTFVLMLLVLGFLSVPRISAQTTEFTYQGSLQDGAVAPTANYDFQFRLFDSASGGTQIGALLAKTNIEVANGIFTVRLDFGAMSFSGADRFIEISVKSTGGGNFTLLNPRQKINSAPYAVQSLNANRAAFADNANVAQFFGGRIATEYIIFNDARLTDARAPLPGSTNYVQNTTATQAGTNFNISGTGAAGTLSTNQLIIGGKHGLSNAGLNNFFGGEDAGVVNTGNHNVFFGPKAGFSNKGGSFNSFFGPFAGTENTTGRDNAFFGVYSGQLNTTGNANSFFGPHTGLGNITGNNNAFFGTFAGNFNSTGSDNSFFGNSAGFKNNGNFNAFYGSHAGNLNLLGSNNSFLGTFSGQNNTTGSNNAFVGAFSGNGNAGGNNNSFYGHRSGYTNTASENSFFGHESGFFNGTGAKNSFFGERSGRDNTLGQLNTFIGSGTGISNTIGSFNTLIGANADFNATNLTYATAIGAEAIVGTSNTVVIGRPVDSVRIPGNLTVTGTLNANVFSIAAANITGILGVANGGTGLGAPGAIGSFLRSNGNAWFSSSILAADIPLGSTHYIQNGSAEQALSSFNVSGTGTIGGAFSANSVNSTTNYKIGAATVLSTAGSNNVFAGAGAGLVNSGGASNAFFGTSAGNANVDGSSNAFFGANSGLFNSTGGNNTLIGSGSNVASNNLTFATALGSGAVVSANNSVVLGRSIDTVRVPGSLNVTGDLTGGFRIPVGNLNGILAPANGGTGLNAVGAAGNFLRSNGTSWTNSLILASDIPTGSTNYIQNGTGQQSTSNFNISGAGTVGGTLFANLVNSTTDYNIGGNRVFSTAGTDNVFAGAGTGTGGSLNSFFGDDAGAGNVTGTNITMIGADTNVSVGNLSFATAIGAGAVAANSNSVVLGRSVDTVRVPGSFTVTGNFTAPLLSVSVSNITGVLPPEKGGTGSSSIGPAGTFLRSNGTVWASSTLAASDIPFGSSNYIQNGTGLQGLSNFNISGTGTVGGAFSANSITSATDFRVGVNRVFSTIGTANVFAGAGTGTTGNSNSFFGHNSGANNISGSSNTLIGAGSDVGGGNLSFATAVGSGSVVGNSNSVVLGRAADTVRIPGNFNLSGNGTVSGNLTVNGNIVGTVNISGSNISGIILPLNGGTGLSSVGANGNFLRAAGGAWTSSALSASDIPTGSGNYIQNGTGLQATSNFNISGSGTVGGTFTAGAVNADQYNIEGVRVLTTSGTNNTIIGPSANVAGNFVNSTAVGANAMAGQNNSLVLGSITGINGATANTAVGIGTITPKASLDVTGGDILVGTPGQGIILKSPNGLTCRRLSIDNTGNVTLVAVPCP